MYLQLFQMMRFCFIQIRQIGQQRFKLYFLFWVLLQCHINLSAQQATINMLGIPPYGFGGMSNIYPQKDSGFSLLGLNTIDSTVCGCNGTGNVFDTTKDFNFILKRYNKHSQLVSKRCIKFHDAFWKEYSLARNPLHYFEFCSDGNFIMSGVFHDTVGVLVKVDSNANILWKKEYPGTRYGFAVEKTKDGGYVLSTGNNHVRGLFDVHYGNWSTFDALIIKTDSLGNIEYHKVYGSPGDEVLSAIPLENGEDYYFFGASDNHDWNYPDFYCTPISYEIIWGVRKDFSVKWQNCYNQQYIQYLAQNSLPRVMDSSNNVVLNWADSVGGSAFTGFKFGFEKIDSNGNIVWRKVYGPDSSQAQITLTGTVKENPITKGYVMALSTEGIYGDVEDAPWIKRYYPRSWTLFLDPDGSLSSQLSLGGNASTFGWATEYNKAYNNFILLGGSASNTGNFTHSHIAIVDQKSYEGFFANVNYWALSVEPINEIWNGLSLFPNPAHERITVKLNNNYQANKLEVFIHDMSGRVVQRTEMNMANTQHTLDVSALPGGMYLIQVKSEDKVFQAKLIKQQIK